MQSSIGNKVVGSDIGELDYLLKKGKDNISTGKIDNFVIANYKIGEVVILKGIKFRIKRKNDKKKTIELKMLCPEIKK